MFNETAVHANGNGHSQPLGDHKINNEQALLGELVQNSMRLNRMMQDMYGDKRRNIERECGYVDTGQISCFDYQKLWDRDPVAGRVVNVFPMECWQQPPQLVEDADPETLTDLEAAWIEVGKNVTTEGLQGWYQDDQVNTLWNYLERADIYSGIGSYGCIMFGIDDGKELSEPADLSAKGNRKLSFIRVLSECEARISAFDTDEKSPRYGRPSKYSVITGLPTLNSSGEYTGYVTGVTQNQTKDVHWSRIQHVVDNPYGSEVGGIPRCQQPYNRLYDLHKMYGGSTEMYWQGAFPGISFETHPSLGGDVKLDEPTQAAMRSQLVNYTQGLQRYLTMAGMSAKTLSPQVVDPASNIDKLIEAICILTGIPKRIFMGSERGELASTTDLRSWYGRCRHRQTNYTTPFLVARFVDRLILLGVLPAPKKGYGIDWQDLMSATELEKAQVGVARTQAAASYVSGGVVQLVTPKDWLTSFMGFDTTEANQMLEDTQENMDSIQEADPEQQVNPPEPNQVGNWAVSDEFKRLSNEEGEITHEDELAQFELKGIPLPITQEAFDNSGLKEIIKAGKKVGNTWSDEARKASAEARKRKVDLLQSNADDAYAKANRLDTHEAHKDAASWFNALAKEHYDNGNRRSGGEAYSSAKYHEQQAQQIASGVGSDKQQHAAKQLAIQQTAKQASHEALQSTNIMKGAKLHTLAAQANTKAGNTEQANLHKDIARVMSEKLIKADSTELRSKKQQKELQKVADNAAKEADKATLGIKTGAAVSSTNTRGHKSFGVVPIDPATYPLRHARAAALHDLAAKHQTAVGNHAQASYHKGKANTHRDKAVFNSMLLLNQ